jgi:hypothetical protein
MSFHATFPRFLLLAAALLLASLLPARAQYEFSSITAHPESGIEARVTGYFSELPISGYAPIRVQITNRTKGTRRYTFSSQNSSAYGDGGMRLNYTMPLAVESGEQRTFEVMAPLSTMNDDEYVYNQLRLTLSGQDITDPIGSQQSQHRKHNNADPLAPYVGLSKAIATNYKGPMTADLRDVHGVEFVGGDFDPAYAPADWRAYAGVDTVFITVAEMEAMAPGATAALLDWVAQGGKLYLLMPASAQFPLGLLGMPELKTGTNTLRKGLGYIGRVAEGETSATARAISRTISGDKGSITTFSTLARKGYDSTWSLQNLVRALSLNAPIILIFMLGFAILVGPVNLFVFAKAKQRYRLFWTTPLISLGTSLLLFIVILLQDGTGGSGARASTIFLIPGQNKMVHIQEQLSRTGLLFSQNFKLTEGVYPAQMLSHNKRLAFQNNTDFSDDLHLRVEGNTLSGDWFRSRERQTQLLSAVSPTRGTVDVFPPVTEGDAPSIQSSIGLRLEKFYYTTGGDGVWVADNVDPGERVTLKKSSKPEMAAFVTQTVEGGGMKSREGFKKRVRSDEPYFVAQAERPGEEYMLETLPSVRWKNEKLYFVSFLGKAEGAKPGVPLDGPNEVTPFQ